MATAEARFSSLECCDRSSDLFLVKTSLVEHFTTLYPSQRIPPYATRKQTPTAPSSTSLIPSPPPRHNHPRHRTRLPNPLRPRPPHLIVRSRRRIQLLRRREHGAQHHRVFDRRAPCQGVVTCAASTAMQTRAGAPVGDRRGGGLG